MEPSDFYRTLWRHRMLIASLTAIVVGVTSYMTARQPTVYKASLLVRFEQRSGDEGDPVTALSLGTQLAETASLILETPAFERELRGTRPEVESRSPWSLEARPVKDREFLWIDVTSREAAVAVGVADAVPATLADAVLTGALAHRQDLVAVDRPTRAPRVSDHLTRNVLLALALGLVFNSALVLLLDMVRDRLPEASRLESEFGVPVLAVVPRMPARHGAFADAVKEREGRGSAYPVGSDPKTSAGEAMSRSQPGG